MPDNIRIGNQILLLRKRNSFTQDELSEKLGITAQAISKWENGHALPETSILPLLAKLLNTSIDSILSPIIVTEGAIIPFGKYQWRVLKVDGNSALIITEGVIKRRAKSPVSQSIQRRLGCKMVLASFTGNTCKTHHRYGRRKR
ncbi:MAG: helix-turn-helix domain-containing protein [Defluviitaleaceae bacterium]|nr:helix-turn-helix domain-containing protein [Defluviitaleaceae bacterium]